MSTQILMPALSPTMEEGKLARWLVKEGDTVKSGTILAEIETDKATMEFEAVDEGRIGKILVPEGSEGVKVNAPIAILLDEGEKLGAMDIPAAMKDIKAAVKSEIAPPGAGGAQSTKAEAPKAEAPKAAPAPSAPAAHPAGEGNRLFASPLARRIAAQKGVDLAALAGSGPRGRIVAHDVEHAQPGLPRPAAAAPAAASGGGAQGTTGFAALPDAKLFYKVGEYEEIPHDSMRKAIAKRLTAAKALIPHYYLTIDCNLTSLMALIRHPDVNASWTDTAILRHKHADVGIAVAIPSGLITPIVFAAETKGLAQISNEVKELAGKAKDKKLKPNEYEGGGFSVSNLGMFGVKEFTSIINPPQSCIIAVGAGEERAIVVNGKIEVATMMSVTMSCDHRVVDGATGAKFLQTFKQFIEEPASMLL